MAESSPQYYIRYLASEFEKKHDEDEAQPRRPQPTLINLGARDFRTQQAHLRFPRTNIKAIKPVPVDVPNADRRQA